MPSLISPQTSAKMVGGCGTAVDHVLAMAFNDPSMDDEQAPGNSANCAVQLPVREAPCPANLAHPPSPAIE